MKDQAEIPGRIARRGGVHEGGPGREAVGEDASAVDGAESGLLRQFAGEWPSQAGDAIALREEVAEALLILGERPWRKQAERCHEQGEHDTEDRWPVADETHAAAPSHGSDSGERRCSFTFTRCLWQGRYSGCRSCQAPARLPARSSTAGRRCQCCVACSKAYASCRT